MSERAFWENMSPETTMWASGWNAEGVSDPTGIRATAQSCVSYTPHCAIHFLLEICVVITTNFQQMAVNCLKEGVPFPNSHNHASNL